MRFSLIASLVAALCVSACTPTPPVRWAEGGSPLTIARARWDRPDGPVDVLEDGRVLMSGSHTWTLDRVGRVLDHDNDPVALLLVDGNLAGTDHRALGYIGEANTAPPGDPHAWISIDPSGQVIRFDSDGNRFSGGVWSGCQGPQVRVCALVTHLVTLRELAQRPNVTVGVGFGMTVVH